MPRNGLVSYYRHTFTVNDPASISSLFVEVVRDDGAVVYINGTEVARPNMPAGTITNSTQPSSIAYGASEFTFFGLFR